MAAITPGCEAEAGFGGLTRFIVGLLVGVQKEASIDQFAEESNDGLSLRDRELLPKLPRRNRQLERCYRRGGAV